MLAIYRHVIEDKGEASKVDVAWDIFVLIFIGCCVWCFFLYSLAFFGCSVLFVFGFRNFGATVSRVLGNA